jgi:hypothetical protein
MSDPETSGAPTTAPAETAGATPSVAPAGATQPFGTFGSTRGSGLARGKRPTPAAASAAAPAAPSGYKPSSLEVIVSKSEYVNPFTGETTVSAPVVNEPAPQAAPAPSVALANESAPVAEAPIAKIETPVPAAPAAKPAHVYIEPAPAALQRNETAPAGELFPFNPPASSAPKAAPAVDSSPKPELNILPPQEAKRPAVSWDATSGVRSEPAAQPQRRDERATFRTERNRREGGEAKPFEPREPRRDERKFEPRANQPYQPRDDRPARDERPARVEPAAPKKSGGFLGWLKGLFGGGQSPETPAAGGTTGGNEPRRDVDRDGPRRHRGGRGRGRGGFAGDNRGPRDGQQRQPRDPRDEGGQPQQGGGNYQPGGEPRGEGDFGGGGGRRRRRGGRGRFRGEDGDRGERGPRPEGQQGGGAI